MFNSFRFVGEAAHLSGARNEGKVNCSWAANNLILVFNLFPAHEAAALVAARISRSRLARRRS
jgi:hypothetical protein